MSLRSRNLDRDLGIVEMKVLDRLSYREISQLVDLSYERVRQIVVRTLSILRNDETELGALWVTVLHLFGEPGDADAAEKAIGRAKLPPSVTKRRAATEARRLSATRVLASVEFPSPLVPDPYRIKANLLGGDPIPLDRIAYHTGLIDRIVRPLGPGRHRVIAGRRLFEVFVTER
jgi:hypothetical protein